MAEAEDAHLYRSLDESRHEIRLFELLPSPDLQDPIRGHLHYAFLSDTPEYEALSYAWGGPDFTEAISLNGRTASITPNLDGALRHIRLADKSRTLWIDAICINQTDLSERAHQVTLMKQIYEKCSTDLLWLGPNPKESSVRPEVLERGIALLGNIQSQDEKTLASLTEQWEKHLVKKRRRYALARLRSRNSTSVEGHDEKIKISEKELDDEINRIDTEDRDGAHGNILSWLLTYSQEEDLETVLKYPAVWNRIWVMQELSCAPRIQLIAGESQLDWDVISAFLGDSPYADAFHGPMSHGTIAKVGSRIFGRAQTIHHQRRIVDKIRETSDYKSSLLDVLARFKSAHATDPRDKIYGLLGLTTDAQDVLVTYERTAQQIYTDITTLIINQTGNLDIICQSPWRKFLHNRETRLTGLPSWVADFLDGEDSVLLFAQRSIFNAGRPSCKMPPQVTHGTVLHTHGVVLGQIGPILQSEYADISSSRDMKRHRRRGILPLTWMKLYLGTNILDGRYELEDGSFDTEQPIRSSSRPAGEEANYITGEPAFTAFWRTLLTDCTAYPMKRLTSAEIKVQDAILRDRLRKALQDAADERPDDAYQWDEELGFQNLPHEKIDTMYDANIDIWTFTMMDNGLYVLIVPPAREGDIVACIDGGKVPVVLRPLVQDGKKVYQIMTVAYVHGFMDMEASESSELREKLGLKEEELLLV